MKIGINFVLGRGYLEVYIRSSKKSSIIFPMHDFSNLYLAFYSCDRFTLHGVRKIKFTSKKIFHAVLRLLDSVLFEHASKRDTSNKKIRNILHCFFDNS